MGYIGAGPTRFNTADELTVTGDAEVTGAITTDGMTTTGNVSFGDNDKAVFGDKVGGDLVIYHNASDSYITDLGTGNLRIGATNLKITNAADTEVYIDAFENGAVNLRYDNGQKLATTSTGVDVTGTVTADGLTVAPDANRSLNVSTDGTYSLILENTSTNSGADLTFKAKDDIVIKCNNLTTFRASAGGDISFYDDTGTTQGLFWDASTERLGVGTTSPSGPLHTYKNNTNAYNLFQGNAGSWVFGQADGKCQVGGLLGTHSGMIVDTSGNVGIGNSIPNSFNAGANNLVVGSGSGSEGITIYGGAESNLFFADGTASADNLRGRIEYSHLSEAMKLYVNNSEAIRIDSSGNVGIGTSSPSLGSNGSGLHIKGASGEYGVLKVDSSTTSEEGWVQFSNNGVDKFRIASDSSTNLKFIHSGVAERLRIDSSGRVGIGTSSVNNTLEIKSTTNADGIRLSNAVGSYYHLVRSNGDGLLFDADAGNTGGGGADIRFQVKGSERMRIDSSGILHFGKTATSFATAGIDIRPVGAVDATRSGGPILNLNRTSSVGEIVGFYYAESQVGTISVAASSTSYNTSSDYRLKENVTADWDATTRLKQLNPVRFNFIADADTTVDGFLAHEVQDIVPEAITGTKDAMRDEEYEVSAATGDIYTPATEAVLDEDGNEVTPAVAEVIHSTDVERPEELAEGKQWRETTAVVMGTRSVPDYQGIDQSKLVPLLVKTIQELEARIAALETA